MKKHPPVALEMARLVIKEYESSPGDLHGAFKFNDLVVLSSGVVDKEWEHVSISLRDRAPTWSEMCYVKDLFWDEEEVVMQLHPKKSEYVNCHPYCLHLWRPRKAKIPTPPPIYVGPRE